MPLWSVWEREKTFNSECLLTKFVADCDGFSWVRRLADTSRVAATNAERVGFPLGEIKQRKARRFYWDLCIHPLPAVCARNTLTYKVEGWNGWGTAYCAEKEGQWTSDVKSSPSPHSTWLPPALSLLEASSSAPHSFWSPHSPPAPVVYQEQRFLMVKKSMPTSSEPQKMWLAELTDRKTVNLYQQAPPLWQWFVQSREQKYLKTHVDNYVQLF